MITKIRGGHAHITSPKEGAINGQVKPTNMIWTKKHESKRERGDVSKTPES